MNRKQHIVILFSLNPEFPLFSKDCNSTKTNPAVNIRERLLAHAIIKHRYMTNILRGIGGKGRCKTRQMHFPINHTRRKSSISKWLALFVIYRDEDESTSRDR